MAYSIPYKLKLAIDAATYKRVGELFAFSIKHNMADYAFIELAVATASIEILMDLDEKLNSYHYNQAQDYIFTLATRHANELISIKNGIFQ